MTLWERANNAFFTVWANYFYDGLNQEQQRILTDKFGPDFPSLQRLINNISFHFVNSNHLLDLPQVITSKVVYVGGIVKSQRKELASHTNDIFEKPSKGVVLFSFGTIVNETRLPAVTRQAILDAFIEFPDYEFIWKNSAADGWPLSTHVPNNVHLFPWIDQVALLGKTRKQTRGHYFLDRY
ncbi:Protein UGT-54 [Aphelenchoides avenae]|nr:Protein UGT-54 [Aphelenchus avenae]